MAYLINNYDGTPLVNVQDRTLNLTATSLQIPGRDYRPYGEIMVENMIYMLQHFSNATPPQNAIQGQIWYDTNTKKLKVYDSVTSTWQSTSSPLFGTTLPLQAEQGEFFYHVNRKQLFVWDTEWRLVGPLGALDNSDNQITTIAPNSTFTVGKIPNTASPATLYNVIQVTVEGTLIAVIANNTFNAALPGFGDPIVPGVNLRSTYKMKGTATNADVANNSLALDGVGAAKFFRLDRDNEPQGSVNLGSNNNRFNSIFANNFVGTVSQATLALTANTATTASSANVALNAVNLDNQSASFYRNASNLNTGTIAEARLPADYVKKIGDTMSGALLLSGDPTQALQAATKQYVDNRMVRTNPYLVSGTSLIMPAPSGFPARRVTVIFDLLSINNNSDWLIQLGTNAGIQTTGYVGGGTRAGSSDFAATAGYTAGFGFGAGDVNASDQYTGRLILELTNVPSNVWIAQGSVTGKQAFSYSFVCGGRKVLPGVLTQIALVVSGSGTFDGGAITLVWE